VKSCDFTIIERLTMYRQRKAALQQAYDQGVADGSSPVKTSFSDKNGRHEASGALLIFDGDCGFCTTAVHWLERNLPAMPPSAPYQWTDLERYGLTAHEAESKVWMVVDGRTHGGHLAVSALLRHQPHPLWRFAGWMLATPPYSLLAAVGYRLVARYRHRLPGGTPACAVRPGG
jgi:predicted DCC family thiol-disulfide oxidoreductase YuxK